MDKPIKFTSYNQITKEFDVMILNRTEIKQLNNDDHFLVLKPKKEVVSTKPNSKRKQPSLRQLIMGLVTRLDQIEKRLDRLEQIVIQDHNLLMKVIKLNNLKTE